MAARTGQMPFAAHLEECEACRTLLETMAWLGSGSGQLEWAPPTALVRQHKAIPLLVESRCPARVVRAPRVFDSWTNRPALPVRQAVFGVERRVRFSVLQYEIELVANRQLDGWELAVRVYDSGVISRRFVLQAGRRRLPIGCGDCFVWTCGRPPRRVGLLSPEIRIDLEDMPW